MSEETKEKTIEREEQEEETKEEKIKGPIRIRENLMATKPKGLFKSFKKKKEYGINIELSPTQVEEARSLKKEGKPIVLKIKEEGYKTVPEPQAIEPLLFLIKENGYTDILENVKPGPFTIADKKNPDKKKVIFLTPDKLTTFKFQDKDYRGWVAYENCPTPMPEDPIFSSEQVRKIIEALSMNYKDLEQVQLTKARTKMFLIIGGLIILAIIVASALGIFDGIGAATVAAPAATGAVQLTG